MITGAARRPFPQHRRLLAPLPRAPRRAALAGPARRGGRRLPRRRRRSVVAQPVPSIVLRCRSAVRARVLATRGSPRTPTGFARRGASSPGRTASHGRFAVSVVTVGCHTRQIRQNHPIKPQNRVSRVKSWRLWGIGRATLWVRAKGWVRARGLFDEWCVE